MGNSTWACAPPTKLLVLFADLPGPARRSAQGDGVCGGPSNRKSPPNPHLVHRQLEVRHQADEREWMERVFPGTRGDANPEELIVRLTLN